MSKRAPDVLRAAITSWVQSAPLEDIIASDVGFGLSTISPLQRAICRMKEGTPLGSLWEDPHVREAFCHQLPEPIVRLEIAEIAGIRTGKSLFAGCFGVIDALRCDVSKLGPGEVPRLSIVSLKKDLAAVVYGHMYGRIQASPIFRTFLLHSTADTVTLRHPSGRTVEVAVVAGSRAGSSLVARWSAGVIFDEFGRMQGTEAEGVVNWKEMRKAVLERLLPGAQLFHITSPYAPFGPAYDMVQAYWGKPTEMTLVVKAPAYAMNPHYWTPARCEEAKQRDPDVYRTDVLAEFASPEENLIPEPALVACTRDEPEEREREPDLTYFAAMDPATRGNGWTLAVVTRRGDKRYVVGVWEWVGSKSEPLNPRTVLGEIAGILKRYAIRSVDSDQWAADALQSIADEYKILVVPYTWTQTEATRVYLKVRTLFLEGRVELPPNRTLRTDLLRLRKKALAQGAAVILPPSSDGRHCDFAPSVALGLSRYLDDADPSVFETPEHREERRMRDAVLRKWGTSDGIDEWANSLVDG